MRALLHCVPGLLHQPPRVRMRGTSSRAPAPEVTLVKQEQEQVHGAASETDTGTQPPWLLPGMELKKTVTCEALCLQRRVSLGRRGEAGSSLKLLHQTRGGHTANLLWKLATERSPGHDGQQRGKRTRVLLEQTGSSLDRAQHTPPCATCPCVPHPCKALQEQSLAQSLFRGGSGMYPHKPRTCEGTAEDMFFSSRKATSPHILLSHNRAEKPLSSVTVLKTKLQCQRQDRL